MIVWLCGLRRGPKRVVMLRWKVSRVQLCVRQLSTRCDSTWIGVVGLVRPASSYSEPPTIFEACGVVVGSMKVMRDDSEACRAKPRAGSKQRRMEAEVEHSIVSGRAWQPERL